MKFLTNLVCALLLAAAVPAWANHGRDGAAAVAQRQPGERGRAVGPGERGRAGEPGERGRAVEPAWANFSRDDAAAVAQRQTGGRVLAVERAEAGGRPAWRVKVVTPRGDVRVILIDVATGQSF